MQSKYIQTNGVRLHYLEAGRGKPIIVMHGLTANANAFDGLIAHGFADLGHIYSVDLRGRGKSEQPPADYSMKAHSKDIIGMMDLLGLEKVILVGHSFGALMSWYLFSLIPHRIEKIVFIDAAARLHPDTRELLQPTMSRLGKIYTSYKEYMNWVREAPFLADAWDEDMQSYFDADIEFLADGQVTSRSKPVHIIEAVNGVFEENWEPLIRNTSIPSLLINATGAYGDENSPPLLPKELAKETVEMMPNCQYLEVEGNHQTMMYGKGAKQIVQAIKDFLSK
ncbi:alpha/beta fold hydrolase [Fulvivirgaceae bacterium LMO-SS25]